MFRNLGIGLAIGVGFFTTCMSAHGANFFSPTQTQLNTATFTDYWPGNGAALNSNTLVGADGVQFDFNTGYASPTPDAFSRSQFTIPFTQDLTGFGNIGVAFQQIASVNGHTLQAQVDLHYASGQAFSGWTPITAAGRTNIYLNLGVVPAGQLSQINSIDIEMRSDDAFDVDMHDKVNAFTAPAPPSYLDGFQISDFEGNDAGTWGPAFQPDHVHTIVTADGSPFNNGVTKGTHALQIARTFTGQSFPVGGTNLNFRWGSQMALNASTGAAATGDYNNDSTVNAADYAIWRKNNNTAFALQNRDPANTGNVSAADYASWKANFGKTGGGTDPVIQGKINSMVDAINAAAPTGRLAFDVSFLNTDQFPNANPSFLGYHMFITDGSGAFYQDDDFGFPAVPALGDSYKGLTLSVPISGFTDRSANNFGSIATALLKKNATFTIGLASNTNGNATFVIDNFRVQTLAPGSAAAVPEPASIVLAIAGLACGMVGLRRRA